MGGFIYEDFMCISDINKIKGDFQALKQQIVVLFTFCVI